MELKNYQQDVLNDITDFNNHLYEANNLRVAFRNYWKDKGVASQQSPDFSVYKNTVPNVPRVTIKVPTAGGKTFIACNAIRTIFDQFDAQPKVVAWFVPTDTILEQTLEKLKDVKNPYRQKLDSLFNNRVCIYDKASLLLGQNFNPTVIREQLNIFVLSIQSFATNSKEGRLAYRENENLVDFSQNENNEENQESVEPTSLIHVISQLNPVVIIDESHNFKAQLRVETLCRIQPRYILELTATPRDNSNIISYVDSLQLKREQMVKLPVIVYNQNTVQDVLAGAINLQRFLESEAQKSHLKGDDYIRPIVLFQAQPKINEENETFDKIKNKLLDAGIPEEHIKIKTSQRNELKGIDLMSPQCPIRYIITVDALKEGWDCPFAYILASLANKTSKISVEQILGRILRLPYVREHESSYLNLSYVFTCSNDFQQTISSIVHGLNLSGFSSRDFFSQDYSAEEQQEDALAQDLFSGICRQQDNGGDEEQYKFDNPPKLDETSLGTEDFEETDVDVLRNQIQSDNIEEKVNPILKQAFDQAEIYKHRTQMQTTVNHTNPNMNSYKIKNQFLNEVKDLRLPQFHIKVTDEALFPMNILLQKNYLLEGFKLSLCDKQIKFNNTVQNTVQIDLKERSENEYVPMCFKLNQREAEKFLKHIQTSSLSGKRQSLIQKICKSLSSFNYLSDSEIHKYVTEVLRGKTNDELDALAFSMSSTIGAFEAKFKSLCKEQRRKRFHELLKRGELTLLDSYKLPTVVNINQPLIGFPNGLYLEEEGNLDKFEARVLLSVANEPSVLFWHRNPSQTGFSINGYVNQYPDFIIKMRSGKMILLETKGNHLDGSDSVNKVEVGQIWESRAGDKYRYYMVFETDPIPGAYDLPSFLEDLKHL